MSDVDRRRALAAINAWFAPANPVVEPGDIDDMTAALAEPSDEAALRRWAYKPDSPIGVVLDPDDLRAMTRARDAAAEVTE